MLKYPLQELEDVSTQLQKLIAESRNYEYASLDFKVPPEERGNRLLDSSKDLMNKAGVELLPKINKILGKIEALLNTEDKSIYDRVQPLLEETKRWAQTPTNPLGYNQLSANLTLLAGHLSAIIITYPNVFVGHRFIPEDEEIANKFINLFELEGLKCITGKPPRPMEVDEKAQELIIKSDAVVIIFTLHKKIQDSEYYTAPPWIKSELSFAHGKGKPFLIFYENVIDPDENKGIQGEFEFINFDRDRLDECFLKAIPYIREFRLKVLSKMMDR